jgi:quercetin dioxygenase-like cupin family protein
MSARRIAMTQPIKFSLETFPVHLGLGAKVSIQDEFTGSSKWYERYGQRTAADGAEGRLVSMFTFKKSWDTWEMHPHGDELVLCVRGTMTLIQEINGRQEKSRLRAGEAIINPAGVWHTADIDEDDEEEIEEVVAVFVTAGLGTESRPRA